jgi:hypothetical protein
MQNFRILLTSNTKTLILQEGKEQIQFGKKIFIQKFDLLNRFPMFFW